MDIDSLLKGYTVNQQRLEYLEKAIKLIDMLRLTGNDAKEVLRVIGKYTKALDLLDDYGYRTLNKVKEIIIDLVMNFLTI